MTSCTTSALARSRESFRCSSGPDGGARSRRRFRYAILNHAFRQADLAAISDQAQAVGALGLKPRLVQGSPSNIKVTYPEDLELAAAILAGRRPRD